jgi:hypothetical protein
MKPRVFKRGLTWVVDFGYPLHELQLFSWRHAMDMALEAAWARRLHAQFGNIGPGWRELCKEYGDD